MKQFVVLGLGRSGSNLLVNRLNTPGSVCFGEIYHPVDIFLKFPVPGYDSMKQRDKDPVGFYRALHGQVVERYPKKRAWGYKLFLHHSRGALEHMCADPDIAVVVLQRKNMLARYSSTKKAIETGAYRKLSDEGAVQEDRLVEFVPSEFRKLVRREQKLFEALYKKLDKHAKAYHEIEYCELGSPEAMAGVFAHLGIEGRASEDIRVQKQGSAYDMLERFSNPEDVVRYVEINGMEAWLHEQSPRLQPA